MSAADVLLQQWNGNRYIELAGPRRYSALDIAGWFASILGRTVEAVAVPRESWITDFFEQGTPEERSEPRIEMLDAFNSGWIDFGVPGTEHISGVTKLRTVLQALVART